jgi:hypothetical protein
MKFFRTFLIVATVSLSSVANAGLTITFDTNAETFSFSASQAAVNASYTWGAFDGGGNVFNFGATEITGSTGDAIEINNGSLFIQISGQNFFGTGATVSYATATANEKTYVGTLNGSTLGSNDALDAINITVVPEPSQYAALGGVALLGFAFLRRHLSRQQEIA